MSETRIRSDNEREALMELVDALEHERPRYGSKRVRTALALARDALCVCAETSARNCPVHMPLQAAEPDEGAK